MNNFEVIQAINTTKEKLEKQKYLVNILNAKSIHNATSTTAIQTACDNLIALDDTEHLLVPLIFMAPSPTSLTGSTNPLSDGLAHPSSYYTIIQKNFL